MSKSFLYAILPKPGLSYQSWLFNLTEKNHKQPTILSNILANPILSAPRGFLSTAI